ncbi:hypothetical protein BDW22DRAFT_1352990 [Trametopsis cervina]|nr:hypothetical protein BDW22DRAFT_1352990 [Trametopsis cervina]
MQPCTSTPASSFSGEVLLSLSARWFRSYTGYLQHRLDHLRRGFLPPLSVFLFLSQQLVIHLPAGSSSQRRFGATLSESSATGCANAVAAGSSYYTWCIPDVARESTLQRGML